MKYNYHVILNTMWISGYNAYNLLVYVCVELDNC